MFCIVCLYLVGKFVSGTVEVGGDYMAHTLRLLPSRAVFCLFCSTNIRLQHSHVHTSPTCRLGSGLAQDLLRICSGWLTFAHSNYHFRQAAPQYAESLQL